MMSVFTVLDDLKGLGRRLSVAVEKAGIQGLPSPLDTFVQERTSMLKGEFEELNAKLKKTQDELVTLKEAHRQQSEWLKSLLTPPIDDCDAVQVAFDADIHIVCSRTVLCRWSPALKALFTHGNGLAGNCPRCVHMHDVTPEAFQAALNFRCSGHLCEDVVDASSFEHPLLKFSDCFDLQDLRSAYLAVAETKVPLSPETARWHLSVAATANDSMRRDKAWRALVADESAFSVLHKEFALLSFDDAKGILAQDCLKLPSGEISALALFSNWVLKESSRIQHSVELLRSVRLSLLTVKQIMEFQHEIEACEKWGPARQDVLSALCSALEVKLSGDRERKRKHSLVDDGPEEQSNLKMMRAARRLFGKGASSASA